MSPVRVLLVEDGVNYAGIIARSAHGSDEFEISAVTSLADAVRQIEHSAPEAVLSDLQLPDGGGVGALTQLRAVLPRDTPIVVLSGCDDPSIVREAMEAGAHDVLMKDRADGVTFVGALRHAILRTAFQRRSMEAEAALRDSEVRETAEGLRKTEAQLRQAQKMEAIGRLAGGVAHDFNNVLTAIFGYADLILDGLDPNHRGRNDVLEIKRAAERAASLTRQLLAFSRKQVLQPRRLCLNDVVRGLQPLLERLIGEDIELHIDLDASLGEVRADPGQIEQVLMNLAANARDAMPEGGRLSIATANEDVTPEAAAAHEGLIAGRFVRLTISDTGHGIPEDIRRHIFEPFFTTKEQGKGTGLGLATVYGIVKQSGGWVYVSSEAGQATVFTIYLSRVDAATSSP